MTISLALLCAWALLSNIIALFPSKRHHWPAAYFLVATGIPLMGYIIYENHILVVLVAFLAWVSVLRWPLLYGWKWVKKKMG